MTCKDCRHWQRADDDSIRVDVGPIGHCLFAPPVPVLYAANGPLGQQQIGAHMLRPATKPMDTCSHDTSWIEEDTSMFEATLELIHGDLLAIANWLREAVSNKR